MKIYVDYLRCPKCDIQLEYRNMPVLPDGATGPLCSECATKLRRDTSEYWRPFVIVDFK